MFLRTLSAFLLAALLANCSPVYSTTYALTPPADSAGQQCVAQCKQSRQTCAAAGQSRHQSCVTAEQARAQDAFVAYRLDKLVQEQDIDKAFEDFHDSQACGTVSTYTQSCRNTFRDCFTACGGTLTPQSICVRNCS